MAELHKELEEVVAELKNRGITNVSLDSVFKVHDYWCVGLG